MPALAAGASKDTKLTLVAYSTPKDAYGQLISAFQKTQAGNGVSFSQSYGASGEQSRAVAAGLDADIVAFSLEPDITSLVQKKLVAKSWNKDKYKGMVTRSVVVFVVRDGNPKKLKTWNDLLKPGVQVITPNPFTSGRRPLERDGRVRRSAPLRQDAEAGRRLPRQALEARRRAAHQRARRSCRPSSPAAVTSSSRTRTKRCSRRRRASRSSS